VAFSATMLTWVQLEHMIFQHVSQWDHSNSADAPSGGDATSNKIIPPNQTSKSDAYRALTISDIRPSLFTLYLLQSAFFSTGNIASISSFSLDAVYRLIPIFDPFSQGALLMFKILVPFIILSAALGIHNKRLGFAPGTLFMGLIVFGDWLTINFFWMVRDEGSWLEIGETISRFCIVSGLCVFVAALEVGSTWLVGDIDDDKPQDLKEPVTN
jgi:phosphatidylinositol glycan class N